MISELIGLSPKVDAMTPRPKRKPRPLSKARQAKVTGRTRVARLVVNRLASIAELICYRDALTRMAALCGYALRITQCGQRWELTCETKPPIVWWAATGKIQSGGTVMGNGRTWLDVCMLMRALNATPMAPKQEAEFVRLWRNCK